MAETTQIDGYEVFYASNQSTPRIILKSGGQYIGQLFFEPNGSKLQPDQRSRGATYLYYHLEDFPNVLDLLRNESPILLNFVDPGGENSISTIEEAVGEGEV
jgi:hypothetical protein